MEVFQHVDKAAGILSTLLAIGTGFGQISGLSSAQKRIEAIDQLLADKTLLSSAEKNSLRETRRKLQARITSIVVTPGTALYLYALDFLGCLAVVIFSENPARDTVVWNLMIMVFMALGASGVIRIAGARAAIYKKILHGSGASIQTAPYGLLGGRMEQVGLRLVFAFVAIFVSTFSIVALLLAILGEWQRFALVAMVIVPLAYICWRAWLQYVKSLFSEQQRTRKQILNEEIEELRSLRDNLRHAIKQIRQQVFRN